MEKSLNDEDNYKKEKTVEKKSVIHRDITENERETDQDTVERC